MDDFSGGKYGDQANHIWSMLNDMSENDPAAYRKFIDKHVKEGKEYMKPPQPHMCVSTSKIEDDDKIPLYINICEWPRLPTPENEQDPIPITGSSIYPLPESEDGDLAIALAFNPKVLNECGKDAAMREEQGLLIGLCLDYLEKQHSIVVSRSYSVLPHKTTHKGPYQLIKRGLMAKTKQADDEFDHELSELEKKFGPGLKNSMLNISGENDTTQSPDESFHHKMVKKDVKPPAVKIFPSEQKPSKPGLIQEMSTSDDRPSSDHLEPEFEIKVKEGDGKGRRICLRVNLPYITSVRECELDISQDDIKLLVPGKCKLIHKFGEKIDDEKASAKYNKKSGILTITLPSYSSPS